MSEGASLTQYEVKPNDGLIADRGLAHRRGIRHVISHGGEGLVRMNLTHVPLEDEAGQPLALLPRRRSLAWGEVGRWGARMRDEQGVIPVRVGAIKKSQEQTRRTQVTLRKRRHASCHLTPLKWRVMGSF